MRAFVPSALVLALVAIASPSAALLGSAGTLEEDAQQAIAAATEQTLALAAGSEEFLGDLQEDPDQLRAQAEAIAGQPQGEVLAALDGDLEALRVAGADVAAQANAGADVARGTILAGGQAAAGAMATEGELTDAGAAVARGTIRAGSQAASGAIAAEAELTDQAVALWAACYPSPAPIDCVLAALPQAP